MGHGLEEATWGYLAHWQVADRRIRWEKELVWCLSYRLALHILNHLLEISRLLGFHLLVEHLLLPVQKVQPLVQAVDAFLDGLFLKIKLIRELTAQQLVF